MASGCMGECEGVLGRGWGKGRSVRAVPSVEKKVHSTGVVRPGTPWDGRRYVSASRGTGAHGPASPLFLEGIRIGIRGLSKAGHPPQCGWSSSNL